MSWRKNWKTTYGVAHDYFHLAIVVVSLFLMPVSSWVWLGLTAVSLICEIHFVRCFKATGGKPEDGIYFVPDGEEYRWVQRRTAYLLSPQLLVLVGLIIFQCLSYVE